MLNNYNKVILVKNQFLLFGDLETGGLNHKLESGQLGSQYYPIFELAFILTDTDLNQIAEPLRIVVHQSDDDIDKSNDWCIETHTKSGLLDDVRISLVSPEIAEQMVIEFLQANGVQKYDAKQKTGAVFVGNSIMFDRSFMLAQMPKLHDYLHYRQLDISALALAARMWCPEVEQKAVSQKTYSHEALNDIQESIAELKAYKSLLFDRS